MINLRKTCPRLLLVARWPTTSPCGFVAIKNNARFKADIFVVGRSARTEEVQVVHNKKQIDVANSLASKCILLFIVLLCRDSIQTLIVCVQNESYARNHHAETQISF